jgi:hypothetical protein
LLRTIGETAVKLYAMPVRNRKPLGGLSETIPDILDQAEALVRREAQYFVEQGFGSHDFNLPGFAVPTSVCCRHNARVKLRTSQ